MDDDEYITWPEMKEEMKYYLKLLKDPEVLGVIAICIVMLYLCFVNAYYL